MNDRERSERIRQAVLNARKRWLRANHNQVIGLRSLYRSHGALVRSDIIDAGDLEGYLTPIILPELERRVGFHMADLSESRNRFFESALLASAALGSKIIRPVSRLAPGAEVPAAAIEAVNTRALEWLYSYIAEDGIQLSPRLWRTDIGAKGRVITALEHGVAQGEAIHKTAENLLRGAPDAETLRVVEKAFGQRRAVNIGKDVHKLFTPKGARNIVFNTERVLITETNRINGYAFIETSREAAGSVGMRWTLSSSHPKTDICDDYATRNDYGLGPGGYPFDKIPTFPAHPLCLCYLVPIFAWEVNR